MRNSKLKLLYRAILLIILCSSIISIAGDPQYKLTWYTIDGGGGQSSGGQYVLMGTIGQPDAAYSSSGNYQVLGGFWPGGALCFIDFVDFSKFALYWMESGSGLPADLFPDDLINSDDLIEFVNLWLCTCPYNWPLK